MTFHIQVSINHHHLRTFLHLLGSDFFPIKNQIQGLGSQLRLLLLLVAHASFASANPWRGAITGARR